MSDNALVKIDGMPIIEVTEDEFKLIVSGDWLPRIQVVDSNSKVAKKKQAESGNYALVRGEDDVLDLTNQVDVLVVHVRWTALDTNGDTPTFVHERESDEFKRIEEESLVQNSGCMWGPEFLLYIPSVKSFATFFCASATARRESKHIFKLMHKAATLKTHFIEKGKHSWYGPLITECSSPFDIPPSDEIKEQALKFANPITRKAEAVADAPADGRER